MTEDLSYDALLTQVLLLGRLAGLGPRDVAFAAVCAADFTVPQSRAFRESSEEDQNAVWRQVQHTALSALRATPVDAWPRVPQGEVK